MKVLAIGAFCVFI